MFQGNVQSGHAQYGLVDGGQSLGVEKDLKWKMAFFFGACVTMVAAVIAVFYFVFHWQWAPCAFSSQLFLLIFAILLMILDAPVHEGAYKSNPHLYNVREKIYTYLLFLTRFTGRGVFYLFLSSMVFVALWDENINMFLGIVLSLLLFGLGGASTYKGFSLSIKLNQVRVALNSSRQGPEQFVGLHQSGLSKVQFSTVIEKVMNQPSLFTSDDLDHVINALSFKADNDGVVSLEEFRFWLREGPMLLV